MNKLILAPTCSGKTYYAAAHPGVAVDGDVVCHDLWPSGRWWDDHGLSQTVNTLCVARIASYTPSSIILFNVDPVYIIPELFYQIVVVIPEDGVLESNARARSTARVINQPTDAREVLDNADKLYRYAIENDVQLFATISEAVDYYRVSGGGA